MTRQILEAEMDQAGLRLRPAIEVEGRDAVRELVLAGMGVGVVSAAEFGDHAQAHALPIIDCRRQMTETLVCLREQSGRRLLEAFLALVDEGLAQGARA